MRIAMASCRRGLRCRHKPQTDFALDRGHQSLTAVLWYNEVRSLQPGAGKHFNTTEKANTARQQ